MKNKYDRIGYWPTDMGVTEDEYKFATTYRIERERT